MAQTVQTYSIPARERLRLWLLSGHKVTELTAHPEPQAIGSYARGRQLMGGNYQFAGDLIVAPGQGIWHITPPTDAFAQDLHRFGWLDDLAAVGTQEARGVAQLWALDWVDRYGLGRGPGWGAADTGRRMIHSLSHAPLLLAGLDAAKQKHLFRSLGRQAAWLRRDWPKAPPGLPRVEALVGEIYAGISLAGQSGLRRRAIEALAESLTDDVDNEGGIPSRSPEDLLEVYTLLGWVLEAFRESGQSLPDPIWAAMERITPTLRALRHVDGGLARFHGGGRGRTGQLDKALVTSGLRTPAATGQAMGFATLSHGRISLIADASAPPRGRASVQGHASTLAFEMTSGGYPVIVNCGSGRNFGPDWAQACRASASHSTLSLDKFSSSRLSDPIQGAGVRYRPLVQTPKRVIQQKTAERTGTTLILSHDGYAAQHGLTHLRRLSLNSTGTTLSGEDSLRALSRRDKARFDDQFDASGMTGLPYAVRFHLHPDTEAFVDMGGRAISVTLQNREVWVFRCNVGQKMELAPSVYMDPTRFKPRATKQIVLSARAMGYAQTIEWQLTKAQSAPTGL